MLSPGYLATCLTSMDHLVLVKVIDRAQDLPDALRCILLSELALFADPVEKLAARSELGDDIELVLCTQLSVTMPSCHLHFHWAV